MSFLVLTSRLALCSVPPDSRRTSLDMMKLTPLALLALASTSVSAFSTASAASRATSLASTVQDSASTKTLLPPLSTAEIMDEEGRVSALYDTNVQKTYG